MHNDHLPQLKKKAGKSGLCSPISRQCKTIVQTTVQIPLKCKLFVRLCNISFFATLRPQILLTLYIIVTYLCFLLSVKKYISFCAPYIRLEYMTFDNLGLRRNLRRQSLVNRRQFRILRCINDRLPSHRGKIFREFDPPLHPRPTGRRPIVCDYQNPFHHAIESLNSTKIVVFAISPAYGTG